MTISSRNISAVLVVILIGLILYFIPDCYHHKSIINYNAPKFRIDTVYKFIKRDSIRIVKAKPKIIILQDTASNENNFVIKMDTVLLHDTISLTYKYPENELDMILKSAPDTLRTIQIAIQEKSTQEEWWHKPSMILGGIIVGYFINDLRK